MLGDGALVEFSSAVDAVECAIAIQGAMAEHNSSQPEREQIGFRIGVNLGEIVIEGNDIFGDGVNVKTRLEAQAPKAGILTPSTDFSRAYYASALVTSANLRRHSAFGES